MEVNRTENGFVADNSLVHLRQSLQRLLDAGFTVGAHHAFYGQGLFHSGLLLLSCIFLRCGLHKGSGQGRDVFGRVVTLCAVQVKQVQSQGVTHHAEAGKAHGSCAEHGVQRQPQGDEHTGCQRNADDVIDKRPEQVFVDVAQGSAAQPDVLICPDRESAVEAVASMMKEAKFGASGARVVIEEFLTGPEVSVLAFTDGKTVKPMVSSMDHKRALDHDEGLNTGGMGTIAPNPCYTPELAQRCMDEIFLPTIAAMNAEGRTFTGCLYFGLMMTPKGPKVIEYNCRFGDPETQVVLPLLKSDLLTIMRATVDGTLADTPVEFASGAACCVVLASGGYPVSYKSGYPISGLDEAGKTATVFHAGTKLVDGQIVTAGGRVLGVTATADTLEAAIDKAYQAADKITFTDMHMRRDIGQRALASRKESHS